MTRYSNSTKLDNIAANEYAKMKKTIEKYETGLLLFDQHFPYMHEGINHIALEYARDSQPKYIIFGGDLFDNPEQSVFPIEVDHKHTTQEEIDGVIDMVQLYREVAPDAKVVWLYGNHDYDRFQRRKSENNKGLGSLRNLNFEKVIKDSAADMGYDFRDVIFDKEWTLGSTLHVTHGDPRTNPLIKGGVTGPRRTAETHPFPGNIVYGHKHKHTVATHPFKDSKLYVAPAMLDPAQSNYVHYSLFDVGFMSFKYSPNSRPKPIMHMFTHLLQPNGDVILDGKVYSVPRHMR